ncbi:MAG: hypothetical protein CSA39_04865 [Flavobacteriales bacterium]|nr:MAG: hypothetical protein CSA39_04865 [Flavobacteriales bacterium]
MIKSRFFLFLVAALFFAPLGHGNTLVILPKKPSVEVIRNLYIKASESEENTEKLYNILKDVDCENNPTLAGYKAASMTLKAKYAEKIINKKKYFKEGAVLLESLISENPNNIELRLIRLSIQESVPKLLKYHKNIKEDAQFIVKQLAHVKDKDKKEYIKAYAIKSYAFTSEEKTVLSKL